MRWKQNQSSSIRVSFHFTGPSYYRRQSLLHFGFLRPLVSRAFLSLSPRAGLEPATISIAYIDALPALPLCNRGRSHLYVSMWLLSFGSPLGPVGTGCVIPYFKKRPYVPLLFSALMDRLLPIVRSWKLDGPGKRELVNMGIFGYFPGPYSTNGVRTRVSALRGPCPSR